MSTFASILRTFRKQVMPVVGWQAERTGIYCAAIFIGGKMNISTIVKARRAQLGLSQRVLAAMLGVHVQSVRNYERGMPPARKLVSRLADILQVDIEDTRRRM